MVVKRMKRFKVSIEAKSYPDGDDFVVYAKTAAEAKKKAIKLFEEDMGFDGFDYLEIEVKGKDVTKNYIYHI
jgi:hypothetical protein